MKLPFTQEQFFSVFGKYNTGVFPIQILFYLLAVFALYLLLRKRTSNSKVISLILGFFWFWMGLAYHILYFTEINQAAYIFGILFIIQGGIFIYSGVIKDNLAFTGRNDVYGMTGWVFIIYGLIIYPLIGSMSGHLYPNAPVLGAPCPTTIFTFGVLLFTTGKLSKWIILIPLVWSLLGFSAAMNLSVPEDFGLIISGVAAFIMITYREVKKTELKIS